MPAETLIPAPDITAPTATIPKLYPIATMIEPKVATPNDKVMVFFLPKLSEM